MASLRSLAISLLRLDGHTNIAAANRHHARDPQRTLTASDRMNDFAGSLGRPVPCRRLTYHHVGKHCATRTHLPLCVVTHCGR